MELTLELPDLDNYLESDEEIAIEMLNSLFYRITYNMGKTSLVFWLDKFSDHKQGNRMILALAESGVINTSIKHNYAEIEMSKEWLLFNHTQEELDELITANRLNKYLPLRSDQKKPLIANQVKLVSGIKPNGLTRPGFAKAGHHEFKYDTQMMTKYKPEIIQFSIKAMTKMEAKLHRSLRIPEGYDYGSIIEQAIDIITAESNESYILGSLVLDSRGRAIYETLKTIFNPLSNKMARALVVTPPDIVTPDGLDNAYLCIAELRYGFTSNIIDKIQYGQQAYRTRSYHSLDLSTEKGIDDLFENIWLERLYNDIEAYEKDNTHKVTTPLEVDFSASNMTIIGLLLGCNQYVNHTSYMWKVDGLSKQHVKFAQTPYVFGSTAPIKTLWTKNHLTFTPEQIDIMRYEQTKGRFAIANEFKDILVKHSHPTAISQFNIGEERFTVECNKSKNVGDTTKSYIVLDSKTKKFNLINHTHTHKVPDVKQFKRYCSSGIIHNRDSRLLDNVCQKMEWILPIHDAGIVTWSGATTMRNYAVKEMHHLYDNRKETVYNYLKSINVDQAGMVRYAKLLSRIEEVNGDSNMNISPYLLK